MKPFELPVFVTLIVLTSIPLGFYGLFIYSKFLLSRVDQLDKVCFLKKTILITLLLTFFTLSLTVSSYMLVFEIDTLQDVSFFVFVFGLVSGLILTLGPLLWLRFFYY